MEQHKHYTKYIIVVSLLAVLVFTSPAMLDSIIGNQSAQVITDSTQPRIISVQPRSIAIQYDKQKKESAIVASFSVVVNGGLSGGVHLYSQSNGVRFVNTVTDWSMNAYSVLVPRIPVETKYADGQQTFYVPAGKSVTFTVNAKINPQIMFPGKYYATLNWLSGMDLKGNYVSLNTPTNKTNTITIVGETSPYISQNKSGYQLTPGQKVDVVGERLQDVKLFVDGVQQTNISLNVDNNGTTVNFILPKTVSFGYHNFQLGNSKGLSNAIWFEVKNPGAPTISSISPDPYVYGSGDKLTITGSNLNIGSYVYIDDVQVNPITVDGGNGNNLLFFTLPKEVPAGGHHLYVTNEMGRSNTFGFTVSSSSQIQPSITVLSPNGGGIMAGSKNISIKWESKNAPTNAYVDVIRLYRDRNFIIDIVPSFVNKYPSSGSLSWSVPTNLAPGDNYSIQVILKDKDSELAQAWSQRFYVYSSIFREF